MREVISRNLIDSILNTLSEYNKYDDDKFDSCAISKKITRDYNLVVWCDSDNGGRYYIVSIRYNPYDDKFGESIGAELESADTSKEELISSIRKVVQLWESKQM